MPSVREMIKWRNENRETQECYDQAVMVLFTEDADVAEAVLNTPMLVGGQGATFATLVAMGYGQADINARVHAEAVARRLEK